MVKRTRDNKPDTKGKKKRRRKEEPPSKLVTARMIMSINVIFLFFVLASAYAFVHAGVVLDKYGEKYKKQVLSDVSYVSKSIKYKRGCIKDRNGNILAESIRVYDMILDPSTISYKDTEDKQLYYEGTVKLLNEVFGIKETAVQKAINENPDSKYYPMKKYKELSSKKKLKFEKLMNEINSDSDLIDKYGSKIAGVSFDEKYIRYYPYKTVAADLIGIVSNDNVGAFGLEAEYNESLNGENGKSYRYYKAGSDYEESVKEVTNGNDVISTIDVNVQGVVEQHIAKFGDQMGARNIGVILMDPNTAEVIAMASDPVYDLNDAANFGFDLDTYLQEHYTEEQVEKMTDSAKLSAVWKSFCISDEYEPGSTFKPFTVAACVDEAIASSNSTYVCDGGQDVSGVYIRCSAHSSGGHGSITLQQALMYSCNDALMQMCANLGGSKFVKYCKTFGFGNTTGIDLPGEATGQTFAKENLGPVELATSSFGQGQTVTMIQMASGICSLVNGGTYMKPHLLKEIQSETGSVVQAYESTAKRRTITKKTSEYIRECLFETVEDGTAKPAAVSGYEVCGKTGTAEKHPTGRGNYLVSFIGCVPKDDPQLVCYVVIDEPKTPDQAHSTYATQFASSLLKDVLPMLDIYPNREVDETEETEENINDINVSLPSILAGNLYDGAPEGGYADSSYNIATGVNNSANAIDVPDEYEARLESEYYSHTSTSSSVSTDTTATDTTATDVDAIGTTGTTGTTDTTGTTGTTDTTGMTGVVE